MTGEPITPELRARILENLEGKLKKEESVQLREQIHTEFKHEYGTYLNDCKCPGCEKPLMFTFAYGPACMRDNAGCGYVPENLIVKAA